MKEVSIIIEQFDNGITFRWKDENGEVDDANIVIPKERINEELGEEIFSDVKSLMDVHLCNKVKMEIKYKPIKEKENLCF